MVPQGLPWASLTNPETLKGLIDASIHIIAGFSGWPSQLKLHARTPRGSCSGSPNPSEAT